MVGASKQTVDGLIRRKGIPMNDTPRRITVLGTGKMGAAIAARLAADGYELTLWNRSRDRAEKLGFGRVAGTAAEASAGTDLTISSLTGPDAVRATYLGPSGALAAGAGHLFVDMSTAGPDVVAEIGEAAARSGNRLVDAPILGAPPVVRDGKAAVLLGGTNGDVALASSVLGHLGTTRHVGSLGNGARLKLVANSMLADILAAAAELQVAGEQAGLNSSDVFFALERLAPVLGARRHGFVENRHEPTLFALRDLLKDLDLAAALFGRAGSATPVTAEVREHFAGVAAEAGGLDVTAVAIPYRRAAVATRSR
jgi:3-hydroxyisobutyrate dehydrogenase-like beta-hydroxyacid dehydrogenase